MNLIRAELLKIRTTNLWWIFAIGAFVLQAAAFSVNAVQAHFFLDQPDVGDMPAEDAAELAVLTDTAYHAANLYTSGQFFALLFVMLLGILLVTNEFQHQTATTTFLTTPHRTAVVLAKLVTAALLGGLFWLVSTLINLIAGTIFLRAEGVADHLGESAITRAILLNLLAYTLWGIFGVGFGVLIRSQIGATVTAVVLYLIGTTAATIIIEILKSTLGWDWLDKAQVIVPSIASSLMITGAELPGSPPQYVGAVVLIMYAVVTATVGTLIVRKRDIS
ncbi:MAG TPA: ABC transporter permease [Actinoplanes sp.]|nr:ABC transporter permease [Actinoplanes sp.]